ncbi:hypothetical protein ABYF34_03625 [Buchananella felis]|uniref:hypothetical protein n=1 Tax=Buchananella felis TaxID=3231492 RepID=UPI003529B3B3
MAAELGETLLSSGEADGRTDWEGVCVARAVPCTLAAVVGAVGAAASSVPRPMKKAATATSATPHTAATIAYTRDQGVARGGR